MVTEVTADTVPGLTVKAAVVAPCGSIMPPGVIPAGELDKLISIPPNGAGPVRVTVPVAEPPLGIIVGATATLAKVAGAGGFTVTEQVLIRLR